MLKRLGLTFVIGVSLGLLAIHLHMTAFDTAMTVLTYLIVLGIPVALALFVWAVLSR